MECIFESPTVMKGYGLCVAWTPSSEFVWLESGQTRVVWRDAAGFELTACAVENLRENQQIHKVEQRVFARSNTRILAIAHVAESSPSINRFQLLVVDLVLFSAGIRPFPANCERAFLFPSGAHYIAQIRISHTRQHLERGDVDVQTGAICPARHFLETNIDYRDPSLHSDGRAWIQLPGCLWKAHRLICWHPNGFTEEHRIEHVGDDAWFDPDRNAMLRIKGSKLRIWSWRSICSQATNPDLVLNLKNGGEWLLHPCFRKVGFGVHWPAEFFESRVCVRFDFSETSSFLIAPFLQKRAGTQRVRVARERDSLKTRSLAVLASEPNLNQPSGTTLAFWRKVLPDEESYRIAVGFLDWRLRTETLQTLSAKQRKAHFTT